MFCICVAQTTLATSADAGEASPVRAATNVEAAARRLTVDARFGSALLLRSQSHAPKHFLQPDLRVGCRVTWRERWELGASAHGLLAASEHYRVLGVVGQVRFAPIHLTAFSLGISGGLGAGYDADILHASLQAGARVVPYYVVGMDGRWQVGQFLFGFEAAYQNAALLQAGILVGMRLHPS